MKLNIYKVAVVSLMTYGNEASSKFLIFFNMNHTIMNEIKTKTRFYSRILENCDPLLFSMKFKKRMQARNKFTKRIAVVRLTVKNTRGSVENTPF